MLGNIGEIKNEIKFLQLGTLLCHIGNKAKPKTSVIQRDTCL